MWIKLIITIITLFLLFDEYTKVSERVSKKYRRKIVLSILTVLTVFSVLDTIIEVNEGDALVKKANRIIIQSDTLIFNTNSIITDLDKNIASIEKSGASIIAIDRVLKNLRDTVSSQVDILKESVSKSVELVRLEEKKFRQDQARIEILTNEIKLKTNEKDTLFFDINISYRNLGKRNAAEVKFTNKLLLYNDVLDDFKIYDLSIGYFANGISEKVLAFSYSIIPWKKTDLVKDYNKLILIIKAEYRDELSNELIRYKNHFQTKEIKTDSTEFIFAEGFLLSNKLNDFLIEKELSDYIIERYRGVN